MAKLDNLMEQSAAELQLQAALAKAAELRTLISADKASGSNHAELKLQETFFQLWKKGQVILKKDDAKRLYEATAEKLRGKNIVHAKNHLVALFTDIQSDSFFDEVKPKKAKAPSGETADVFSPSLAEVNDTRSLDEVLGQAGTGAV